MTIHHDKMAYGKVYGGSEVMKEDDLDELLKQLNEECGKEDKQEDKTQNSKDINNKKDDNK